jgi:hypothetical protein
MRLILGFVLCLWPLLGAAEIGSLLGGSAFGNDRKAIMGPQAPAGPQGQGSSLFAGQAKGSFFAPYPVRRSTPELGTQSQPTDSAVMRVRHVIGRAESPQAGYDAVQHGAKIKPSKLPTDMTIGEIYDWIARTPGQPHAIGRYQFIPNTLRRVVTKVGADRSDVFSPALQDKLADVLLADAGFSGFQAGRISQQKFMNNLAAIWAGLPTSTGRSKYHGHAGNRATVTLAYFRSEIAKIAPS